MPSDGRDNLRAGLAALDDAPSPTQVPGAVRDYYEPRYNAMNSYREGSSLADIKKATGMAPHHVFYIARKFGRLALDGKPHGWRAMLPQQQSKRDFGDDIAHSRKPKPGDLQRLFKKYDKEIHCPMLRLVLNRLPPGSNEPMAKGTVTNAVVASTFKSLWEKLKIPPGTYPNKGIDHGNVAIRRWRQKVEREEAQRTRRLEDHRKESDPWYREGDRPSVCYERVECDAYDFGVNWLLRVRSARGVGYVEIEVDTLWLIAIVENLGSPILGYSLAFGKNYCSADVLRAVRSALVPSTARELSIEGVEQVVGDGLPAGVDSRLAFICWDEFWVDGALCNWSDATLTSLEATAACIVVVGPVASPDVRPHVESMFSIFDQAVEMAKKRSPRVKRTNAEVAAASRVCMDAQVLFDCIRLVVGRYNAGIAPGTTCTRIEVLQDFAERTPSVIRRIPADKRVSCIQYDVFDVARITEYDGVVSVYWANARYYGVGLHGDARYLEKNVTVMAWSLDARFIEVRLQEDGTPLGTLQVEKRFQATAHSVLSRQHADKKSRENGFAQGAADIMLAARAQAEKNSRSRRGDRDKYARMALEQACLLSGAGLSDEQLRSLASPAPAKHTTPASPTSAPRQANNVVPGPKDWFDDEDELAAIKRLGPSY